MLTLSVQQPWAFLIVSGQKDVENRSWPTNVRGRVLIHAGKRFDAESYEYLLGQEGLLMPEPVGFLRGGVVGEADLWDCVEDHASKWFEGPFGFLLRNQRELPFRPWRGQLGFFEAPHPLDSAAWIGGAR